MIHIQHIDALAMMKCCPACGTVAVETPLFHLQTYMRCNTCKDDIANLKASVNATKYYPGQALYYIAPPSHKFNNGFIYTLRICGIDDCYMIIDSCGHEVHFSSFELDTYFSTTNPNNTSSSTAVNFWTAP